ncbi:MAG: hypothetical protein KBC96_13045 [Armatimonadetes bacterium]|nr:hypothetical protein [Armatimonadota bacterium]
MEGSGTIGLLQLKDTSEQKSFTLRDVSREATIGELMEGMREKLGMLRNDRDEPCQAFLEREARHLHSSETVGDALEEGDTLVVQRSISAG